MVVTTTDIVGAVFEALDSLCWRFAGTGVVSGMVVLFEGEGSSRSRLSLLDLWDLPDIMFLLSS
jgi:hypothetical protein